ncbi:SDR family NAD(P)-dependent oxidoreductase [Methylomonas sp. MgM2]
MKNILITGSNSAVGIAIAKELARQPVNLALHYYSNQQKADKLKAWLDEKSVGHHFFQSDLTEPEQAEQLVRNTLQLFGSIDALINIVGPYVHQDILELTPRAWISDINLNLHTCFHTSHYALNALRNSQGHIINFAFAGVENTKAWPMSTGYCAAKSGVVALSKSLAAALAAEKVKVNVICPGLVDDDDIDAEDRRHMASQIPFGRPVRPDEIGRTVSWLIWDSPETMTGALISVAGGWEY